MTKRKKVERKFGVVTNSKRAGGEIEEYVDDKPTGYCILISNFDPLAGKYTPGTRVSYISTNPSDHRAIAASIKVLST